MPRVIMNVSKWLKNYYLPTTYLSAIGYKITNQSPFIKRIKVAEGEQSKI